MSDLISRSKLLKEIETWGGCVEALHEYISNIPTAFDTEKVVEQLLDMRLIRVEQCHGDYEIEVMTESNFDDAIAIVKKGGVE